MFGSESVVESTITMSLDKSTPCWALAWRPAAPADRCLRVRDCLVVQRWRSHPLGPVPVESASTLTRRRSHMKSGNGR